MMNSRHTLQLSALIVSVALFATSTVSVWASSGNSCAGAQGSRDPDGHGDWTYTLQCVVSLCPDGETWCSLQPDANPPSYFFCGCKAGELPDCCHLKKLAVADPPGSNPIGPDPDGDDCDTSDCPGPGLNCGMSSAGGPLEPQIYWPICYTP